MSVHKGAVLYSLFITILSLIAIFIIESSSGHGEYVFYGLVMFILAIIRFNMIVRVKDK